MAAHPAAASSTSLAAALQTPLPADDDDLILEPPRAPHLAPSFPSLAPRDSYAASAATDQPLVAAAAKPERDSYADELEDSEEAAGVPAKKSKRRWPLLVVIGAIALIVVVLAVILPVYFTVIKPKNRTSDNSSSPSTPNGGGGTSGGSNPSGEPNAPASQTTGGDGSKITTEDGNTFTYNNTFGGFCESPSFSLIVHSISSWTTSPDVSAQMYEHEALGSTSL